MNAHADTGTQYYNGRPVFNGETTYSVLSNGEYDHALTINPVVDRLRLTNVGGNNSNRDNGIVLNSGAYTFQLADVTYGRHWDWKYAFN